MGLRKNDIRAIWAGASKEPVPEEVKTEELNVVEATLEELKEKHAIKRGRKAKDNSKDNQEVSKEV